MLLEENYQKRYFYEDLSLFYGDRCFVVFFFVCLGFFGAVFNSVQLWSILIDALIDEEYILLVIKHNCAVSCNLHLLSQTECLWPLKNKRGKTSCI